MILHSAFIITSSLTVVYKYLITSAGYTTWIIMIRQLTMIAVINHILSNYTLVYIVCAQKVATLPLSLIGYQRGHVTSHEDIYTISCLSPVGCLACK
jgi:hypothetical protein